jgi:NTE family protein
VLAPLPRGFGPVPGAAAQVEVLRRDAKVALVTPDAAALKAFGRNVLDPAARAGAARAGLAQAPSLVDAVRAAWDD